MGKRKTGLRLHARGQWYICIAGKFHYFGTDQEAAEKRWAQEGPYLLNGLPVPSRSSGQLTLTDLVVKYVAACQSRLQSGEISQRHLNGIQSTLENLGRIKGGESSPANWSPACFAEIKEKLSAPVPRRNLTGRSKGLVGMQVKSRGPGTIAGDIRRIKAFLNWASDDERKLIPPPQFGKSFSVPRKVLRKIKTARGRQDMAAADIRAVIAACSVQFRPIVLLGINCGMGAKDISMLEVKNMPDLERESIWESARNKTNSPRKFYVWPETARAIAEYQAHLRRLRASGKGQSRLPQWESLLFRTAQGNAWVTEGDRKCKDSIGWYFGRIVRRLGLRGKFYDLRRTFETVAGDTLDQMAVNLIMGHVPNADDMASVYLQNISNERIKAACEHVRSWLYGS